MVSKDRGRAKEAAMAPKRAKTHDQSMAKSGQKGLKWLEMRPKRSERGRSVQEMCRYGGERLIRGQIKQKAVKKRPQKGKMEINQPTLPYSHHDCLCN